MAKKKVAKKAASRSTGSKKKFQSSPKSKGKMSQAKPIKVLARKSREPSDDIISMILEDHQALKQLIQVMKDTDIDLDERQNAFEEFAPRLTVHAKPEEKTMYTFMKDDEDLREQGFEGDVEHSLADQLAEEIRRTNDEDLWTARVKVLAELVEHHIQEEEDVLLPDFKKHSGEENRADLGREFIRLKQELEDMGGRDTVEEGEEYESEEGEEIETEIR